MAIAIQVMASVENMEKDKMRGYLRTLLLDNMQGLNSSDPESSGAFSGIKTAIEDLLVKKYIREHVPMNPRICSTKADESAEQVQEELDEAREEPWTKKSKGKSGGT